METELKRQLLDLKPGDHLCLIYDSLEEQLAAVVPFIANGIAEGRPCVYIVDDRTGREVEQGLEQAGVDVPDAYRNGCFRLLTKRETYLKEGYFEPDAMLSVVEGAVLESAGSDGETVHLTGEMTWALGPEPGTDRLIEYEARLNDLIPTLPTIVICQYNKRRFSPEVIQQVLRTHPIAVVGQHVCPNPYYESPTAVIQGSAAGERLEWMLETLLRMRRNELALRERAKEADCLQRVSSALMAGGADLDATLQAVVELIPGGWQFEDLAGARMDLEGRTFESTRYRESTWQLSSPVVVEGEEIGSATVAYADLPSEAGPDPFLPEERALLEAIAARVAEMVRRRRSEAALEQSEAYHRALIERASDIISILEPDGTIRYQSPSVQRVLGYSPGELVGSNSLELVHADDRDLMGTILIEGAMTPGALVQAEYRCRRKDGSWRHVESAGHNLLSEPAVHGIVVSTRDVTERKELEAQLRQAQKLEAIGRLAGGVAHDFNNLLTAIKGYTALLREALDPEGPAAAEAEEILKAAERASNLTRQLLAFSKRQVLEPRVLGLNEVIQEMETMLRQLLGEEIELLLVLQPDAGSVRADLGQLEQVVLNLVVNAHDALPAGGRVIIETRSVSDGGDSRVILAVHDTGDGIPSDVQEHIFEPFFTTKADGTGLGLATVYGVVKQSGGDIQCRSAPGEGTTFEIVLPRTSGTSVVEATAEPPLSTLTGSETILLVEDDVAVRPLARRILEGVGYTVLEGSTGETALALAADNRTGIDLLLTDLVLPAMGGHELAEHLKRRYPDLRVVITSGYPAETISTLEALPPGTLFLEKPFTAKSLRSVVRRALDRQ